MSHLPVTSTGIRVGRGGRDHKAVRVGGQAKGQAAAQTESGAKMQSGHFMQNVE